MKDGGGLRRKDKYARLAVNTALSFTHDKRNGSGHTDDGICENNQSVCVVEPFYPVAALVVIPFLEHELEVAGLESTCRVSTRGRGVGNTCSAEKFARWRILVTAAESWRWEEEEAARSVPLGREMDMADVDFQGGDRRPCRMCCMEGREEATPTTAADDKFPQKMATSLDAYNTNVRASLPRKLDPPLALATFGEHRIADDRRGPSSLKNRYRSDAGKWAERGNDLAGWLGWTVGDDIIYSTADPSSFLLSSSSLELFSSFSHQRECFRHPLSPPQNAGASIEDGWRTNGCSHGR